MDRQDKDIFVALRKEYLKEVAIRVAAVLVILGCIAALGSNDYGARIRGDTAVAGMVVGVPLYILYKLLTMKRTLIAMRRQQLIATQPALRKFRKSPFSYLTARLIPLLWVILLVVAAGVFFSIWWTGR